MREFFSKFFNPKPVVEQRPAIRLAPLTTRDIALAMLYKEIKENPADWEWVKHDQIRKLNKLKLSHMHSHLYNSKLKISICAFFIACREDYSINDKIKLSPEEYEALMETWRKAESDIEAKKIIEVLKSAREETLVRLNKEVPPRLISQTPEYIYYYNNKERVYVGEYR